MSWDEKKAAEVERRTVEYRAVERELAADGKELEAAGRELEAARRERWRLLSAGVCGLPSVRSRLPSGSLSPARLEFIRNEDELWSIGQEIKYLAPGVADGLRAERKVPPLTVRRPARPLGRTTTSPGPVTKSDHPVGRRRRRVQGGRRSRAFVRFTEGEFELVRAAADEARVTVSSWVVVSALAAARESRTSVPDDALLLGGAAGAATTSVVVWGRLVELAEARGEGPVGSGVDSAGRALDALGARLTGLLDDLGEVSVRKR
ncbi:hypothetical protein [Actinomadura vinacea]|uniref:hypothetical protein n=1 Tax=Actinomadura vinacea TaxID=115336 RepID=UPI0031CE5F75